MTKKSFFTRRLILLFGFGGFAHIVVLIMRRIFIQIENRQLWAKYQTQTFPVQGNSTLRQRAANKGLIYGVAVRKSALSADTHLEEIVTRECGIIVPEWELKWNFLRPTPNTFDFSQADWLANFAGQHQMLFRGHTLVWHEKAALPQWFETTVNHENARQILITHIETVVSHYAGKIHSWDVVNEAIEVADGREDGLRNTPWLEFLGTDYIDIAFRTAAAADPKALLVYNDYGLDYDTDKDRDKRTAVLNLLKRLHSQGTPIHALGIQAHLSGSEPRFNPEKLREFCHQVANLGLKILITEMDVDDQDLPLDISTRDHIIASVYQNYLSVALEEKAVVGILNWGISDKYTWLSASKPRYDHFPVRTLPMDVDMNPKLAWNALAYTFDHASKR